MTDKFPDNLKYNKDNSWVKTEDGTATVGVVSKAAENAQEFAFIKLPEKGKRIKKGDTYVSLEAVKWSGHLSSPVTGEITDVNNELFDDPSKINKDPYGSWIMKVKLDYPKEVDGLMDAEEAEKEYGG